jgi:hypothetical protein
MQLAMQGQDRVSQKQGKRVLVAGLLDVLRIIGFLPGKIIHHVKACRSEVRISRHRAPLINGCHFS